jgi:hypothetical protein
MTGERVPTVVAGAAMGGGLVVVESEDTEIAVWGGAADWQLTTKAMAVIRRMGLCMTPSSPIVLGSRLRNPGVH